MSDVVPYIVIGLTSGSLYGLAGVGLVLTFRTSGVFNFAHGAIAAVAAYLFYDLHGDHGVPWPVALVVVVLSVGAIAGIAMERLSSRLAGARPVLGIVATVGVLLACQGFLSWRYGAGTLGAPPFLPKSGFHLSDVLVSWGQVIIVVLGVAASGTMFWFLRTRDLGIGMRAVVDDRTLLALSGTSPRQVRRAAWMLGSAFAALTGVLIAPTLGRDPNLLTLLVVQAFGAAAIGAFSSLPLTYVGGLAVGVAAALSTKYVAGSTVLLELPSAIPFIVLFVVLVFMPRRRLFVPPVQQAQAAAASQRRLPVAATAATTCTAVGVAALVPSFVGAKLSIYTTGLIFVVVFVSLAILVWVSGQISLCHGAFVAFGATAFSHLTTGLGVPWLPALLLSGLAVVPLGAFVALPAIRLSGVYLALATFGLALLMQRVVYQTGLMFGRDGYRVAPRPDLPLVGGSTDRGFYYVCLVVAIGALALVVAVTRTRLGRLLRALSESPAALTTQGLSINTTRLIAFALSSFLAGVAGALTIAQFGQVSEDSFGPLLGLVWLAVLAVCGTGVIGTSVAAAALLVVVPTYLPSGFSDIQTMLFGASATLAATLLTVTDLGSVRTARRLSRSPVRARVSPANGTSVAAVEMSQ